MPKTVDEVILDETPDLSGTRDGVDGKEITDDGNKTKLATPDAPSYAKVVQNEEITSKVNFCYINSESSIENIDVIIPLDSVKKINDRYAYTLYGYFLGKRLAFPVVESFVKNAWAKYGLKRIMMNSHGFFFFKFSNQKGMEVLIEEGPCMIRNIPIILKPWTPMVNLKKEDTKTIPVWGRSSFARAMVEIKAENEWKEHLNVAIPSLEGNGYSKAKVEIEYERKPPCCSTCCCFGHSLSECPKRIVMENTSDQAMNDELENVVCQTTSAHAASSSAPKKTSNMGSISSTMPNQTGFQTSNPYSVLNTEVEESREMKKDDNIGTCDGNQPPNKGGGGLGTDSDDDEWISNVSLCTKVSRIILGSDPNIVDVMLISQTDQVIHTKVILKNVKKTVMCSFVYAHNRYTHRRALWNSLKVHKAFMHDQPWCILGDFNAALKLEDSSMGNSRMDIAMREFKECVDNIDVSDVNKIGMHFTWNQKPSGDQGLLKKIDRIMANTEFVDAFTGAVAVIQPCRISDHAPVVLQIPLKPKFTIKPFKFSNILVHNDNFKQVVSAGNLHAKVKSLRNELDEVERAIDADPFNPLLREEHAAYVKAYNDSLLDEEQFLKQKAKVEWLRVGDSNSAFFHNTVKSRVARSRIDVIVDSDGRLMNGDSVPHAFIAHFNQLLGQADPVINLNTITLFSNRLSPEKANAMIVDVTDEEVKDAIFFMGDDKSPGSDGYSACFFKASWDIGSRDVTSAV
uniref:uncharacterized protein LOC122591609 n=1 Tax=Erigeron canadensis TaxID=72917 RepID=UPI001CB8BBBB|nr:uncharacterized protein LOC122591609 [Erigeron canadensis]